MLLQLFLLAVKSRALLCEGQPLFWTKHCLEDVDKCSLEYSVGKDERISVENG